MKNIISIVMLIVAFIAVTHAQMGTPRKTNPFPGHGPFNPNQPKPWGGKVPQHRFRRSADGEKKNHVKVEGERRGGSSSYNVDYGRTVHENKHGSVVLHGGMNKEPHGRPDKHIEVQGEWRF